MNVIFDFDGTISDSMLPAVKHMIQKVPEMNVENFIENELTSFRGRTIFENLSYYKISKLRFLIMYFLYKKEMEDIVGDPPLFEGIKEVLDTLQASGHSLFIITSHTQKKVLTYLQKNNITCFKGVYSSNALFGKHKLFLQLFAEHSTSANQSVYIGDEVRDVQAARRAGVPIISVSWGYNSAALLKRFQPDFLAEHPSEILGFVSQIANKNS